ncbi:MAG TPA: sigma-54 dependent transcriptional regulator [Planctomycetota bacterium]|nr:sigma-54 dependent transcriptional regulator [Planctomycetota bacterium]
MANILVIDDNPTNRETYADVLESEGHVILTAASGEEGLAKMTGAAFDVVLCDLKLPALDGLATMELAHEKSGALPWILITGHGNEDIAVSSIKKGAFNYLTKPVDLARLKATVESAVRQAATNRENQALRRELGYDEALDRIVGVSQAIKQVKAVIRQVAPTDATVLIEGESGTGKELVADAVHALSQRAGRPYVKLNTAAIPRELLESELFGHERGAFTGAVQQKKGRFEVADTGTLFLDEIGEMALDSQVKLLRVLQDGTFSRVGGNAALRADVRLVCATNRNLKSEVLANRFRMDLYYRLNVVNIVVPPLRERREDIPLLAKSFLERLNRRHHQRKELSEPLVQALRRQDWPGNVRELENTIEKLYVLSPANVVALDGFAQEQAQSPAPRLVQPGGYSAPNPSYGGGAATSAPQSPDDAIRALVGLPVDEVERRLILATLAQVGGNKSKAARQLQIGLKTLYRKLEGYGVPVGE